MGNTQPKLGVNTVMNLNKQSEETTVGEEQLELDSTTFTCEICIESMLSNKKFKNKDRCAHPFCVDCLAKYIQVKVEDDEDIVAGDVKCPGLNCEQLLDPLVCRPIISEQLFVKWSDRLCDSAVLEFQRCYCPYQTCSALVINECGGAVKRSQCPNCKKLFCYTCKVPWHAGYRCTESRQNHDANDIVFGVLLENQRWTRCPFCGQAVQRIAGCRSIKCRCGNLFCYKCGGKYHFGSCDRPTSCCAWCCWHCFPLLFLLLGFVLVIYFSTR